MSRRYHATLWLGAWLALSAGCYVDNARPAPTPQTSQPHLEASPRATTVAAPLYPEWMPQQPDVAPLDLTLTDDAAQRLRAWFDVDEDGVLNDADSCPEVPNPNQSDLDEDGLGDACDEDADGDGLPNEGDNCPGTHNPDQRDDDADGRGDACQRDQDEDGVEDDQDNCPTTANADQADLDSDGVGDACTADYDGDQHAVPNDNCPRVYNPDQADLDSDGVGDACDADVDGDGLLNEEDDEARFGSLSSPQDRDRDGVADAQDNCVAVHNALQQDQDGDGVGDACDNCARAHNPTQQDTDEDTWGDVCDQCPEDAMVLQRDMDGDGVGDECDDDDDNDGVPDTEDNCPMVHNPGQEVQTIVIATRCSCTLERDDYDSYSYLECTTAPRDAFYGDACTEDFDGDQIPDELDNCPRYPNPQQLDIDLDGQGDACDPIENPCDYNPMEYTTSHLFDDVVIHPGHDNCEDYTCIGTPGHLSSWSGEDDCFFNGEYIKSGYQRHSITRSGHRSLKNTEFATYSIHDNNEKRYDYEYLGERIIKSSYLDYSISDGDGRYIIHNTARYTDRTTRPALIVREEEDTGFIYSTTYQTPDYTCRP